MFNFFKFKTKDEFISSMNDARESIKQELDHKVHMFVSNAMSRYYKDDTEREQKIKELEEKINELSIKIDTILHILRLNK